MSEAGRTFTLAGQSIPSRDYDLLGPPINYPKEQIVNGPIVTSPIMSMGSPPPNLGKISYSESLPINKLLFESNAELVEVESPSSKAKDGGNLSINLSLREIEKCREACQERASSDREVLDESEILQSERKQDFRSEISSSKEEKREQYFVFIRLMRRMKKVRKKKRN